MIAALALYFFSMNSWSAEAGCRTLEVKIPSLQRVTEASVGEPAWHELSYLIEFCADSDHVFLLESDPRGEKRRSLAFTGGFIERIYQPSNLPDATFSDVPVRTEIIRRLNYKMSDSSQLPIGELRFYAKDRVHSLSARRSRANEWSESAHVQSRLREFSPFKPQLISAPAPENVGIDLVWNNFSHSPQGLNYTLWSMRADNGIFEMTYLIDVEKDVAVPLVASYLARPDGGLLLEAPRREFNTFSFPQIDRVVHLEQIEKEALKPAISAQEWYQLQDRDSRAKQEQYLAARFGPPALKAHEERFARTFTDSITREQVLQEWFELLRDHDLQPFLRDRTRALELATFFARDLLLREFPELKRIASKNLRESIEAFSEASAALLLRQVLNSVDLRRVIEQHLEALPETPETERSCHELLVGLAKNSETVEISHDLRKASFNLSVIRTALEKFRSAN